MQQRMMSVLSNDRTSASGGLTSVQQRLLAIMSNAPTPTPQAVPIEVSMIVPAAVETKRSVEAKRILADSRVNLTVSSEDYNKAVEAGAIFDGVNGVLFVSPRTDLLPVRKWLPFSLEDRMQSVCKVSDEYGILALDPSIPRAGGATKMDGSPDMSHLDNIRVAKMLGLKSPITDAPVGGDTCRVRHRAAQRRLRRRHRVQHRAARG